MTNEELYVQLEVMYRKFLAAGDSAKASEILMKMTDLRLTGESKAPPPGNILLG